MLNIWLAENVTKEMLEAVGLKAEDDESDGDFEVQENGVCVVVLGCPAAADDGGLPPDWEQEVPVLIGLKPEWVEDVTLDG